MMHTACRSCYSPAFVIDWISVLLLMCSWCSPFSIAVSLVSFVWFTVISSSNVTCAVFLFDNPVSPFSSCCWIAFVAFTASDAPFCSIVSFSAIVGCGEFPWPLLHKFSIRKNRTESFFSFLYIYICYAGHVDDVIQAHKARCSTCSSRKIRHNRLADANFILWILVVRLVGGMRR